MRIYVAGVEETLLSSHLLPRMAGTSNHPVTNRGDPTVSGSSTAPVMGNVSPEQMDRRPRPLGAYTPWRGGGEYINQVSGC